MILMVMQNRMCLKIAKNNTEVNPDMTSSTNVAAQLAKTFETAFAK